MGGAWHAYAAHVLCGRSYAQVSWRRSGKRRSPTFRHRQLLLLLQMAKNLQYHLGGGDCGEWRARSAREPLVGVRGTKIRRRRHLRSPCAHLQRRLHLLRHQRHPRRRHARLRKKGGSRRHRHILLSQQHINPSNTLFHPLCLSAMKYGVHQRPHQHLRDPGLYPRPPKSPLTTLSILHLILQPSRRPPHRHSLLLLHRPRDRRTARVRRRTSPYLGRGRTRPLSLRPRLRP
jgi:hypothetical protein